MAISPEKHVMRNGHFNNRRETRGQRLIWLVVIVILMALLWANATTLDEVISVNGQVIFSQKIKMTSTLREGGSSFYSSYHESPFKKNALLLRIARLTAESKNTAFLIPQRIKKESPELSALELSLYDIRQKELHNKMLLLDNRFKQKKHELNQLKAKKKQLEISYGLVAKEMSMTEPLVYDGAISKVELLRVQRVANDLTGELETIKHTIPRIQSELKEISIRKATVKNAYLMEVNDTLKQAKAVLSQQPVDGLYLRVSGKGMVQAIPIDRGDDVKQRVTDLTKTLPLEGTLLIKAKIPVDDMAFIHPGQSAKITVAAYNVALHGTLKGQVEHVSHSPRYDKAGHGFYEIWVRTEKNFLGSFKKPLPVIPGMSVTVDLVTGKKSLLAYLLKSNLRTITSQ
ncbi:MAG: HlyD family efflux transporter periplasmic adaptor subunit [Gammaproteobacteria bacterium]